MIVATLGIGALFALSAEQRCSTSDIPTGTSVQSYDLIAEATPDTLQAGTGSLVYYSNEPPWSDEPAGEPERIVYGQIVRVSDVGGLEEELVRHALRDSGGKAILVPWGSRGDCRRTVWLSSYRWIDPGVTGVFSGSLRPRAEWVEEIPTFDTGWQPSYTERQARRESNGLPVLTHRQFLSLMRTLPVFDDEGREVVAGTWRQWATRHPQLVKRYPANLVLEELTNLEEAPVEP